MRKVFTVLLFILLFSIASFAQTPTPAPVEESDDVVKISTTLIQIDVSVTDKKGNVVKDLKAEDFEIYENGKKQDITNFSFISNIRTSSPQTPVKTDEKFTIPTPTVTAPPRPDQVRRTIALVVDDFNLSFTSIDKVKRALKKFVDEQMQPGDLVAIIRTSSGVGVLQQFTSDRRQLYAAIENIRWSNIGTGNITTFEAVRPSTLELINGVTDSDGSTSDYSEQIEEEARNQQAVNDFRNSVFATATLGSISFVVRGMQKLPGRKSVMLLSDGFPVQQQGQDGKTDLDYRVSDEMRRLIELANRASVVIYTMDAKGLESAGFTAEDDLRGKDFNGLERIASQRRMQLREAQDSLYYLAVETGGIAVKNNNDINSGIRQMLDDQSYYLIGYQPDEETFDPQNRRFNKFEIKVKRPELRVRYRSGFFGISDEKFSAPTPANNLTESQKLTEALTSPFAANEINLRLNALFGNEREKGSFVRSFLRIEGKNLQFIDEPNGKKKASFDILALSFNVSGDVIDQIGKSYTITVDEPVQKLISERGITYDFIFPMKKDGAYQLRVAVLDKTSGKIGSASQLIEIPNVNKNRLTLSGIVLENISFEQWQKTAATPSAERRANLKSFSDTANRQFKRGTVLNYGLIVYNAKSEGAQKPQVTTQIRLFRDGKVFFEGKPQAIDLNGQSDLQRLQTSGSLRLGNEITTGDYILQVIATDNLGKNKIAAQSVAFEVIP